VIANSRSAAPSEALEGRIFWSLRGQLFHSMLREAFSTARLRTTVLTVLMGLFWVALFWVALFWVGWFWVGWFWGRG